MPKRGATSAAASQLSINRRNLRWMRRGSCITPLGLVMARITKEPNGCWEWAGTHLKGYAIGHWGTETIRVYRRLWEIENGPVPEGLEIDHLCKNRGCCNPDHLEAVTHQENVRRAWADQTHCRNGHLRSEAGQYVSGGVATCRECVLISQRRAYHRKRAAA